MCSAGLIECAQLRSARCTLHRNTCMRQANPTCALCAVRMVRSCVAFHLAGTYADISKKKNNNIEVAAYLLDGTYQYWGALPLTTSPAQDNTPRERTQQQCQNSGVNSVGSIVLPNGEYVVMSLHGLMSSLGASHIIVMLPIADCPRLHGWACGARGESMLDGLHMRLP